MCNEIVNSSIEGNATKGRKLVLKIIKEYVKVIIITIVGRFHGSYKCLKYLQDYYELQLLNKRLLFLKKLIHSKLENGDIIKQ